MLCSMQIFLPAEVLERVSKHGYHKMAVQALKLAQSEHKGEIYSSKKQEIRRIVVTKALTESS